MKKYVRLANYGPENGRRGFFATIKWVDGNLSITGVEGPMASGDARGSSGQVTMPSDEHTDRAPFYDRFREVWERWHLNDMRAGCEHQRENWDARELLEVVSYGLTSEAHKLRRAAMDEAARAAIAGEVAELTYADRFLLGPDWFRPLFGAPDADGPKSGLYEVRKRETRSAGTVTPEEHPRGLLGKPCEVCGYRYGSAWLREEVPGDVIAWLESLPDATGLPDAWK